ncbi:hypothetical protein C0674_13560 [Sporolactobacillus terrae]|uniref:Uncharacterized protein n=1 Tax=Sporolactobacillus terrae TaxID=269673 RepID=A0ABX5QA84_9BACL|nr:hypothetical protein C0674_13560 [Sporolactobacillus terrae]QAA26513.1 hypothetical protein C0679_13545 [Sporolactobacillus terrae]
MNEFLTDLKKRFTGKRLVFLTIPYLVILLSFLFLPYLGPYESMILLVLLISYAVANWIWDRFDRKRNQNKNC